MSAGHRGHGGDLPEHHANVAARVVVPPTPAAAAPQEAARRRGRRGRQRDDPGRRARQRRHGGRHGQQPEPHRSAGAVAPQQCRRPDNVRRACPGRPRPGLAAARPQMNALGKAAWPRCGQGPLRAPLRGTMPL